MSKYPVAIVGGGPTGLVSSILLSLCSIPHVLYERYPSTSIHPKACGYNHRTLEIFRQLGVEPEIILRRAPKEMDGRTAWYTSFGPNGREIVGRNAWGGGIYQKEYETVSPCSYTTLPQIRLEPILQRRALELNPDTIYYNAEVIKVVEKQDHVLLTVQHQGKDPEQIQASYCITADGGRGLTDDLGIGWDGERDIVDMVSAHVRGPISQHHPDIRNFITWFINPSLGGSIGTGYLYHLGPYPISTETEEWLFAFALNPDDPERFDKDAILTRMRNTLQIPDLKVELLSVSHWYVNALCATRYRSQVSKGRLFLVGDAAHRIPPWGALGLNTGVQDVHNLIWKLNLAINGAKGIRSNFNALLDTYDEERRPIGQRVRTTSLHNLRQHSNVMDTALGINSANTEAANMAAMDAFLDPLDDESGAAQRAAVDQAQKILDQEFHAIGAEIGWFYPALDTENEGAATGHGGQLGEDGGLDLLHYHPSTIPGHHLPHAWLEAGNGTRVSTRDLLRYDGFLLITSAPELWVDSVSEMVGGDLVRLVGIADSLGNSTLLEGEGCRWRDVQGQWAELCGLSSSGALLVRPDGIVVWRARDFQPESHAGEAGKTEVGRAVLRALKLDGSDEAGGRGERMAKL